MPSPTPTMTLSPQWADVAAELQNMATYDVNLFGLIPVVIICSIILIIVICSMKIQGW